MPIEIVNMAEASASDNIRLALVGQEKTGKSRCAATGRKNVLFLDFDQRREAVAGIPGVYAITFKDRFYPMTPDAAPLALDIMTALEKSLDLADLKLKGPKGEAYALNPPPPKGTIVGTIVNDSMSTLADAFRNYEMSMNSSLRREISIGVTKSYFPNGWDTWNAETSQVIPFILRQFALPGVDVIAIFHEAMEKADDSTSDTPKFTGKVSVFPARYQSLIKYFSEVWRMKLVGKSIKDQDGSTKYRHVPRVYPLPDASFNAASAMLVDPEEEPNIEEIIKKHQNRRPAITTAPKTSLKSGETTKQLGE